MQFLNKLQPLALLLLRIGGGALFFSHGWAKLSDSSAAMSMFAGLGLPGWLGIIAGAIETAGGLFFFLGLFTRLSSLVLFVEMCIAIVMVHWKHAPWWDVKTYEPAIALCVISFALASFGPGPISIDHALFRNRS